MNFLNGTEVTGYPHVEDSHPVQKPVQNRSKALM
jgi:hypothetical protein